MSWEALIARFVPHPGCGPNSIYTRINSVKNSFDLLLLDHSLKYRTHSVKFALINAVASLQPSTHKASCTLWPFLQSVFLYVHAV